MSDEDWESGHTSSLATFLNGDAIGQRDRRGQPIVDDSYLLVLNGGDETLEWKLPARLHGGWKLLIDTAAGGFVDDQIEIVDSFTVDGRSMVVLLHPRED